MKKPIAAAVIVLLAGGIVALGFLHLKQRDEQHELAEKLLKVKEQLSVTTDTLLGYTKYTDYVSETTKSVEGQTKFLAAKVVREYTLVEHIQKSVLGIKSDATVINWNSAGSLVNFRSASTAPASQPAARASAV